MEGEVLLAPLRGTAWLTLVTQATGSWAAVGEHVCPLGNGQGVHLNAQVRHLLVD